MLEELKKAKEYVEHREGRFDAGIKLIVEVVTSMMHVTSPMEWDAQYMSDGQDVVFIPIRIPKMFTDIFKQAGMSDKQIGQIKQCLGQKLLMEALTSLAMKNVGISEEDLKKIHSCPNIDEALKMAEKLVGGNKRNGEAKGL